MAANPDGVLLVRDELTAWLATLDRPGREGYRAFYFQCWNGDTSHAVADFAAAVLLVTLAGAVNRRASIQPKEMDDSWIVIGPLPVDSFLGVSPAGMRTAMAAVHEGRFRLRSVVETRRSNFQESQFLQAFATSGVSSGAETFIGKMPAS